MRKEELAEELKNKHLYIVGLARGTNPRWDRGIWRKFSIYYVDNDELVRIFFKEGEDAPPSWVRSHKTKSGKWVGGYFESRALGTDRVFEIVCNLSFWLYNNCYELKKYTFLSSL